MIYLSAQMKVFALLCFLLVRYSSIAQSCDTINSVIVNCKDSLGRRQGHWVLNERKLLSSMYRCFVGGGRCEHVEHYNLYKLAEGNYRDDVRVGTWIFYKRLEGVEGIVDKEITFLEGGSTIEKNRSYHYDLTFNKDSSTISGFGYFDVDTLSISCDTNDCSVIASNGKKVVSFNRAYYEAELFRLYMGEYNWEIRKLLSR